MQGSSMTVNQKVTESFKRTEELVKAANIADYVRRGSQKFVSPTPKPDPDFIEVGLDFRGGIQTVFTVYPQWNTALYNTRTDPSLKAPVRRIKQFLSDLGYQIADRYRLPPGMEKEDRDRRRQGLL